MKPHFFLIKLQFCCATAAGNIEKNQSLHVTNSLNVQTYHAFASQAQPFLLVKDTPVTILPFDGSL